MLHDLSSAVTRLFRQPRFSTIATVTLALGIATNITVFAVVDAVLLRPLPYEHPQRLVRIWESNPSKAIFRSRVSRGNFADWRRQASSFEAIEAFSGPFDTIVQFGDEAEIVRESTGTSGFMAMLGVQPVIASGEARGLRMSYVFWRRRFGRDPSVLERRVIWEGARDRPLAVSAVMPREFDLQRSPW